MKTSTFTVIGLILALLFTNQIQAQTYQAFSTEKQALDSTVNIFYEEGMVFPVEMRKYTYDSKERTTSMAILDWNNETQHWDNSKKEEYQYDASGRISVLLRYWADDNTLEWEIGDKEEHIYGTNSETLTYYYWDAENNQWLNNKKYEMQLNDNGDVVEEVEYYFNQETVQWDYHTKKEMVYNSNNYLIETRDYFFQANIAEWVVLNKYVYTYDNNNDLIEKAGYSFYSDLNEWLIGSKRLFTYNNNHQVLSDTSMIKDGNQLVYEDLIVYEYDAEGNKTQVVNYQWVNQWVGDNKEVYLLNASGDLTELDYYVWDEVNGEWFFAEKLEATINSGYTKDQLVLPVDFTVLNYPIRHMIESVAGYLNLGNNNWVKQISWDYYFSGYKPDGIIETGKNIVTLYPNPASDQIFFSSDKITGKFEIELIDQQGRMVLSKEVLSNSPVQIDFLKNGLYLYRVKQDGKTGTGKLIINR